MNSDSVKDPSTGDRLYRALWRIHFYAGLFCIPFIIWLAVTGSIYTLKPQIDAFIDRPYDGLQIEHPAPPSRQIEAALRAVPNGTLNAYELPQTERSAARVLVGKGGDVLRVYVHPQTLEILHVVPEDSRFENVVSNLHGELLLGDTGSRVVELAASWAIIMILTGLYLWWPRDARGLGGVLYPRATKGRAFWRDLHAVTGAWISIFALFFLFSGLPWAVSWGALLNGAQAIASQIAIHHDWTTGSSSRTAQRAAQNTPAMPGMVEMPGMAGMPAHRRDAATPYDAIDALVPVVAQAHLAPPVLIAPPSQAEPTWSARSDAQNRPLRETLTLDPVGSTIVKREGFAEKSIVDRIVGVGVAAHEGQLFAPINQLLNITAAAALILMSVSSVVMWWSRRPPQVLGAPRSLPSPHYTTAFIAATIALGIVLPFFGISLVLVLCLERLLLRRIPFARAFLGL
jgi:uncharacterized iron-regulated membrane protein